MTSGERSKAFGLTCKLVDIPSPTGQEQAVAEFLVEHLKADGWECQRQAVGPGRHNLFAHRGRDPDILLSSHMDTVPPHIPSREDEQYIHGRGSCDAKGQIAAMVTGASRLTRRGEQDLGLLFLVGEETNSEGARAAAASGLSCRWLINGEPTDNHLVSGHKGLLRLRLTARGRAAHSGYPEEGDSAVETLLDVLQDLRQLSLATDPVLGSSSLNVGRIEGGLADNVIPDQAQAGLAIRVVVPSRDVLELVKRIVDNRLEVEVLSASEPQEMTVVEGFPVKAVGFGTDIPALRAIGEPLLFGPGSILDAHRPDEKISKAELLGGVDGLTQLVECLRRRQDRPARRGSD